MLCAHLLLSFVLSCVGKEENIYNIVYILQMYLNMRIQMRVYTFPLHVFDFFMRDDDNDASHMMKIL